MTHDRANWRFQASEIIARPPDGVFDFGDTPENEHLWKSGADVEQTSAGASEAGATGRATGRTLGREGEASWEITEHVPDRKVAYTVDVDGHRVDCLWLFNPVPEGIWVRMNWHLDGGPQGLFGKLSDRVVAQVLIDQFQGQLRTPKRLLEA